MRGRDRRGIGQGGQASRNIGNQYRYLHRKAYDHARCDSLGKQGCLAGVWGKRGEAWRWGLRCRRGCLRLRCRFHCRRTTFILLVGIEGETGRKEGLTAWTIALTDDAHGISTGVPDCMTTTAEGFAAATAEMRAFM